MASTNITEKKNIELLNADNILEIPENVAVCPICKSKLYATFDHWIEENGKWKAGGVHLDCITEPDIDSGQWDYWFEGHWSMPYVDWLPVEIRVLKWINQNYEFDLANEG